MHSIDSTLVIGEVAAIFRGARSYLVRTASQLLPCVSAGMGSSRTIGAKPYQMYSVGDSVIVLVMVDPKSGISRLRYGIILGSYAIPFTGYNQNRVADSLSQMSKATSFNDEVEKRLVAEFPGQYLDANNGVPLDVAPGADHGYTNELGVAQGISRLYAYAKASDIAGFWAFYLDNLVRIAAYNYEFWSAAGERWIKNDCGEVNDVELFTPFPWEALGATLPGVEIFDESIANEGGAAEGGTYVEGGDKLLFEPKAKDPLIIPRAINIRGYLGDIDRQLIVAPVLVESTEGQAVPSVSLDVAVTEPAQEGENTEQSAPAAPTLEKYSQETNYTGLLDIHKRSDGQLSIRSAKGILLEKTICIPVPKQMNPPEQKEGTDTEDGGNGRGNYAPSGIFVGGDQALMDKHKREEWEYDVTTIPQSVWMSALDDYLAYTFNYYNVVPLIAKNKDWYVPSEGRFLGRTCDGIHRPDLDELADKFNLSLPTVFEVYLDHRLNKSKYYVSRSIIEQRDDGSLIIEDGYGSAIHMTGGNVFITAPGDIWLQPGRSLISWAADDTVLRSGSSIDLSAARGDIRLKAEYNLHALAGNSLDYGGILFETRAPLPTPDESFYYRGFDAIGEKAKTYGIVFKCNTPNAIVEGESSSQQSPPPGLSAPIMFYASDIYMRAGNYDGGSTHNYGKIILDSYDSVIASGNNIQLFASDGVDNILGVTLGDFYSEVPNTGSLSSNDLVYGTDYIINRFTKSLSWFGANTGTFTVGSPKVVFDNKNSSGDKFIVTGGMWCVEGYNSFFAADWNDITKNQYFGEFYVYLFADTSFSFNGPFFTTTADTVEGTYGQDIRGNIEFISDFGFTFRGEEQMNTLALDFYIGYKSWQVPTEKSSSSSEPNKVWEEPVVLNLANLRQRPTMPHPGYRAWTGKQDLDSEIEDLWSRFTTYDNALSNNGVAVAVDDDAKNYKDAKDGITARFKFVPMEGNYRIAVQSAGEIV